MHRGLKTPVARFLVLVLFTCSLCGGRRGAFAESVYFDETRAVTLFAFDDVSIPFTRNLKLVMREPRRHPANPVVRRGDGDAPDSWAVQFYGTVLREGETFRMWYVAAGKDRLDPDVPRSSPWRVAYAESKDGIRWEKPKLGLVDYQGSRDNNLVLLEPRLGVVNLKVLRDPADPNPDRRYKMGAHVWFPKNNVRLGTLAPYASRDGLSWKLLVDAQAVAAEMPRESMVLPAQHLEPVGGLYKWDGLFYASGQNAIPASRPYHGRVVRTIMSPDFVRWSHTSAVSFVREAQHTLLGPGRSREGEQTHEGISVWNRGNVLLGLTGMWHGASQWPGVTIDLGFVVSNDGLRFREPAHEHVFLRRGPDGAWDQGGLLQGQGFENIGERTLIYYGAWDPRNWQGSPPRGGVGIAVLPRDRFAELVVDRTTEGSGDYQLPRTVSQFLTAPIPLRRDKGHSFFVNADGLGPGAELKVELLNYDATPLPGYSGDKATTVAGRGFQSPIAWNGRVVLDDLPERVRFRVTFEGPRKSEIRFSALYAREMPRQERHARLPHGNNPSDGAVSDISVREPRDDH